MTARIDTGEPFLKHLQTYKTAYVFVTAETEEFDQDVLTAWRDEGFHTTYVAMNEGGKGYIQRLKDLADKVTGLSDQYAIVGSFLISLLLSFNSLFLSSNSLFLSFNSLSLSFTSLSILCLSLF
jgi:hypothetical protein